MRVRREDVAERAPCAPHAVPQTHMPAVSIEDTHRMLKSVPAP